MKAKTVIHLVPPAKPIRTPERMEQLLGKLDRLPQGGTLWLTSLTGHGSEKRCAVPAPTITRLEEA